MSDFESRITIDPEICNGKPTIRSKRIAVQTILDFLIAGNSEEEILEQYPSLTLEDIEACRSEGFKPPAPAHRQHPA